MPNLTIFAGPNGSGKSTIKNDLRDIPTGIYVNADEIESNFKKSFSLDFSAFKIKTNFIEFKNFYLISDWKSASLDNIILDQLAKKFEIENNSLRINSKENQGYLAALIADFIRNKLLLEKIDFSFETVMSHKSKIEILSKAKSIGYRIILIFVTTNNPEINIGRVKKRVSEGGHNVPEDKIVSRYYNCMDLLWDAFMVADEAQIYDNSLPFTFLEDCFVAEKKGDKITLGKYKYDWFEKYVLEKIPKNSLK